MPRRKIDSAALVENRIGQDPKTGRFVPGNNMADHGRLEKAIALAPLIIKDLEETGRVRDTIAKYGISPGIFWIACERVPELAEARDMADKVKGLDYEAKLDDIIENPEKYDKALTRPSWANLTMFRIKKLMPEYRDSTKIEFNQNVVALSEIEGVAAAVWEHKQKQIAAPKHNDVIDGEATEI